MVNQKQIVIVDPSSIVRCGISTLLLRDMTLNVEVVEINDISTILSAQTTKLSADILIINPLHVGALPLAQLKESIGNDSVKFIALQSSLIDPSTLRNYDEVITIFESVESIISKITDVIGREQKSDSKRELSAREREIIVCVVKGMTNKQIADLLCLSTHTVIAHRRNIATKLQIHSPSGLTIYAIVNKLVDLADIKNSISQNREEE